MKTCLAVVAVLLCGLSAAFAADAPPAAAPEIFGIWNIAPDGTFTVMQDGEKVTWVLVVPSRKIRHQGKGTYAAGVLNGSFNDVENPGGLHSGAYKGWQVNSEGKLCGLVQWWPKGGQGKGKKTGFDCYTRPAPVK